MKAIGGYFELETHPHELYLHSNLIKVNTARNALEYILRLRKYRHLYLPYFTCDVLLEPLIKLNISHTFYDVDDLLEPCFDYTMLNDDEAIMLTNYFGIKSRYIRTIREIVKKNMIVDNAQAFFELPLPNVDTIYSPRKFVGVADGGYISTDLKNTAAFETDISYARMSHLLKRTEHGAEAAYADFQKNDAALQDQPIKKMSRLTHNILASIDYHKIAETRRRNFELLHDVLKQTNHLEIDCADDAVPMVYPYRTKDAAKLREILLQQKIFSAMYWPNVLKWCGKETNANHLTREIIALPIDQRYSIDDMKMILKHV